MGKSNKQRQAESIQREELARDLQKMITLAKSISRDRNDLRFSYNEWADVNKNTIKSLTELRKEIVVTNAAADFISGAACIAGILGSFVSMAGAISDKRDMMKTGEQITKGGSAVFDSTFVMKKGFVKLLCDKATNSFRKNNRLTKILEDNRYHYIQRITAFKRLLNEAEQNDTLPMLLETGQREGFDFLRDLDIDDDTKSKLRTNLRKMCRSNTKKIKSSSQMIKSQEEVRIFAGGIRRLLEEFKVLLEEDSFLNSIFTDSTRKFIAENVVDVMVPCVDTAESWLRQCSGRDILRGGTILYRFTSDGHCFNRTEVGVMSGVTLVTNVIDLIARINDIEQGSKSKESEELEERIEEMKEVRKNITEAMKTNFGWQEPCDIDDSCPALTY